MVKKYLESDSTDEYNLCNDMCFKNEGSNVRVSYTTDTGSNITYIIILKALLLEILDDLINKGE
jgi:hypothetical protein